MSRCTHILVITSERSLSERIEVFLRRKDHSVTHLPSVEEALACIETVDPDLVVVDLPQSGDLEGALFEGA